MEQNDAAENKTIEQNYNKNVVLQDGEYTEARGEEIHTLHAVRTEQPTCVVSMEDPVDSTPQELSCVEPSAQLNLPTEETEVGTVAATRLDEMVKSGLCIVDQNLNRDPALRDDENADGRIQETHALSALIAEGTVAATRLDEIGNVSTVNSIEMVKSGPCIVDQNLNRDPALRDDENADGGIQETHALSALIAEGSVNGNALQEKSCVEPITNTLNALTDSSAKVGSAESVNMENPAEAGNETVDLPDTTSASDVVIVSNILLPTKHPVAPVNEANLLTNVKTSGLSLLAQYDSDESNKDETSDNDSVVEVPLVSHKDYRPHVVEINSDSDSDSSEDTESDGKYLTQIRNIIEKRIAEDEPLDEDDDYDEDESRMKKRQPPKVKGEMLLEDLPPIQDLHITVPEEECIELGRVHSIVEQLVLVSVLPNSILLDLDTVLFLEKGKQVLGEVFDVLGQVADPLYCVRFNSNKQIKEKGINVGDVVYVAPKTQYTQFIILSNLMKIRGSDASWENDIEPPPRFLDYSDDEQERVARHQLRNKDRPNEHDDPQKRQRRNAGEESSSSRHQTHSRPSAKVHRRDPGYHDSYSRPSHTQAPPHALHPGYYPSSWHSNYYTQPHLSSDHYMARPLHHVYPRPPPLYPVPPQGSRYGPPATHQHNYQPPPQFGSSPYNMRPPVLPIPQPYYSLPQQPPPPPPPPGAQ